MSQCATYFSLYQLSSDAFLLQQFKKHKKHISMQLCCSWDDFGYL